MVLKVRPPAAEFILDALRATPFLRDAPVKLLRALEKETSFYCLPGGWRLFDVGEPSDSIYFVLSGSLGAFRQRHNAQPEFVGHIRSGEPVGEMSMLAGEAHQNAVFALRDTELLRLPRDPFMRLIRTDPAILERLVRVILLRLRQSKRKSSRSAEPRVFGLISTSPTIDLRLRARALEEALKSQGQRVAIVGEEASGMPSAWFDDLEARHDVVMMLATVADTPWYRLTLRHADRIWVMARADARPSTPLFPDDPSPARQFRLVDLVLLHHAGERPASQAIEWKQAADAARLFHWRGVDTDDCRRLARVMSGRSVGLVLSGGGARAYAHIGAVRALREGGCPFDFIGGASMGAVIGACVAMGWDDDEIEARIQKAFVVSDPLSDYHLPVVALVKGAKVDERLYENFGDVLIEDLPVPFFAVSSNLTHGASRVHSSGLLREALRASIALPGILPPIVDGDAVLVDGAVMNNFPVDVMRDLHRGRLVGVDVAKPPEGLAASDFRQPPGFVRWTMAHGFSAPPPIANLLMRVATIGINPNEHRELTDVLIVPELDGIELRDWKKYEQAVSETYELTRQTLNGLSGPLAQIIRPGGPL